MSWLKISRESSRPKSGAQLAVHFLLSLALLALSLGVAYLVVMSETRRTFLCGEQFCVVKERSGLFATPQKIASARKPVQIEARARQLGSLSLLMVGADGESEWITAANESPARVVKLVGEVKALPDGKELVIADDGFGIEWYIGCLLLLLACVLNLRNSVRWYLDMR